MRIYIIGMPGSGKTFFGKRLAKALGLAFTDIDELMERAEGKPVKDIIAEKGENYFRKLEQDCLHHTDSLHGVVIACGGGTPAYFDNMTWIKQHGKSIWLHTPEDTILERILKNQTRRPAFASLSAEAVRTKIAELYALRGPFYERADMTLSDNQQTGKMLNSVIQQLMKHGKKHL